MYLSFNLCIADGLHFQPLRLLRIRNTLHPVGRSANPTHPKCENQSGLTGYKLPIAGTKYHASRLLGRPFSLLYFLPRLGFNSCSTWPTGSLTLMSGTVFITKLCSNVPWTVSESPHHPDLSNFQYLSNRVLAHRGSYPKGCATLWTLYRITI